jgi:hypothetical protein
MPAMRGLVGVGAAETTAPSATHTATAHSHAATAATCSTAAFLRALAFAARTSGGRAGRTLLRNVEAYGDRVEVERFADEIA